MSDTHRQCDLIRIAGLGNMDTDTYAGRHDHHWHRHKHYHKRAFVRYLELYRYKCIRLYLRTNC